MGANVASDEKKDGDYSFVPPAFDEEQFVHRELTAFKTTSILFVWGIVAAIASWAAFVAMGGNKSAWGVGLALCAAFGYSLKFLFPKLGADIAHFGRREWLGTGTLFFFTWLSFFILAINPPITDVAAPGVFLHAGPPVQMEGSQVLVDLLATDNDQVKSWSATITRDGKPYASSADFTTNGLVLAKAGDRIHDGHFQAQINNAPVGSYHVVASASDPRGHTNTTTTDFVVGHPISVVLPNGGKMATPVDAVFVQVAGAHACTADDLRNGADCVRSITLRGTGTEVVMEPTTGGWSASAHLKGWHSGNNTFTVEAAFIDHFLGSQQVLGGTVSDPKPYSVDLQSTVAPGTDAVTLVPEPTGRAFSIPAPGLPLVLFGLLAMVAVVRRRTA